MMMINDFDHESTLFGPPQPHAVFAGGGTAGHLFPGLAVATQLRRLRPDIRVTFVGSGKPRERDWVAAAGFDYVAIPCQPLPKRFWKLPGFLLDNLAGYRAAKQILDRRHALVVVGLGGYASAPACRAAAARGAKLVLLEQNVMPGRVNRWLASSADAVCVAFDQTAELLGRRPNTYVTGTPIRAGFTASSPPTLRRRLLVLGGSGGSQSLNEGVPRALYKVREHLAGGEIVHQTGPAAVEATRELYRKLGLEAEVVPFVADMPRTLGWTGLAVSRAGGSTLAELAAAGVPSVLLPYPHAANDHQRRNAELVRDAGGCVVIDEREVAGRLDDALADSLAGLLADRPGRERMSQAIRSLARPDAAGEVAQLVLRLLGHAPLAAKPAGRDAKAGMWTRPHRLAPARTVAVTSFRGQLPLL
jgi:UDP-N-acetylglucosamine--N-acetylmuramyl-(pentapeptide) pyrophosphoryl-undecaprenol N-acetylglucosamine transferase